MKFKIKDWLKRLRGRFHLHVSLTAVFFLAFLGSLFISSRLLQGENQRYQNLLSQNEEISELNEILSNYVEIRDKTDEYLALGVDSTLRYYRTILLKIPEIIKIGQNQLTLDLLAVLDERLENALVTYQDQKVRLAEIARLTPKPEPPPPPPAPSPSPTPTTVTVPTTESINSYSKWQRKSVATSNRGTFTTDIITINLKNPKLRIFTDTISNTECTNNCPVKSLSSFVSSVGGFAGIHGTYFCPPDYTSCSGKTNTFLSPVYDTIAGRWVNQNALNWTDYALIAFNTSNTAFFYPQVKSFGGFSGLRAAIGSYPGLLHNGNVIVGQYSTVDDKQKTVKGYRGGIGFTGSTLYLVIARSATVPDLAYVMRALGIKEALNLDGGGSSALIYNGRYKVGPGRSLPNAIMFDQ